MNELISASQSLQDMEEDQSYLLALSIGSDVYITYNIDINSRRIGSNTVKKAVVGVRAYETTTARLLGTETGYSVERPAIDAVVIEEAINDAIDKVLNRITAYWKEDLSRGIQYKIIINIAREYDEDEAEDIIFETIDVLDKISQKTKEVLVTDYTIDYIIWCNPEQYNKSSKVYREIKKTVEKNISSARVRKISLNKKLVLLKVDTK
jgi:hypothetical protein